MTSSKPSCLRDAADRTAFGGLPKSEGGGDRKSDHSVQPGPSDFAKRKKIDAAELTALPLIIKGGRNSRNWTDEFLRGLITTGLKPNVRMRLESPDLVKAAVRNGAGAGILYRDVIDVEVQRGMFKVLEVTESILPAAATSSTLRRSRFLAAPRAFLRSRARPGKRSLGLKGKLLPISLHLSCHKVGDLTAC